MLGIDIVQISRIKESKAKFGEKFLNRFLDKEEQALVKSDETLAGFYAAKEAASKALGLGIGKDCSFLDIKISKTSKNAPLISFSQKLVEKFNIKEAALSISHDGNFAIAAVVLSWVSYFKLYFFSKNS